MILCMIRRSRLQKALRQALAANPVVALLGPRQCGKTTLARAVARDDGAEYFDLEDSADLARLAAPRGALDPLRGLVIIDEVQLRPDLFPLLRVLADRPRRPARFLLLGSASPELVANVSESLAGRIAFVEMGGFGLDEVRAGELPRLWIRGGFPRSYTAVTERRSFAWRSDFIRTFLERDIPRLGLEIARPALERFWMMTAHYHGGIWNAAEFARSLGSSEPTARRYLDILTGSFVVRQLPPWHANVGKRQVKAPKVYIRDTGILHALLQLDSARALQRHPKCGLSWEGFLIEQILAYRGSDRAFFWATHAGAELDLLLFRGARRIGYEFKYVDAPAITKSMGIAVKDLELDMLHVVYPGTKRFQLGRRIEALPAAEILKGGLKRS